MELALYHPEFGYYARSPQRSGRAGDFFTSVDVGPMFGELLAVQFGEMWRILNQAQFDLVEAAAGSGRLARDVLDAARGDDPPFYEAIRLHLVERSAAARGEQRGVLGPHGHKLASGGAELPGPIDGVIFANELLDALPTHLVVMTAEGLREIYVAVEGVTLVEQSGPPSTPAIAEYLERAGASLQPGWRAEVNLAAVEWIREAARRLRRGFLVLIDYGHEARELYSATHAHGTLASFRKQVAGGEGEWLQNPGEQDLTSHVDLTSVRRAAEAAGLIPIGVLDQTYFLLGLGIAERLEREPAASTSALKRRLALKTLMLPGGLGSTHKVLIFGKAVGQPPLRGCPPGARLT
jgi:SAM-dependent MidA family methyltransferase